MDIDPEKERVLVGQGPVHSKDAIGVLQSAVAVLECGVNMSDERIVELIERIRSAVARQRGTR